MTLSLGSAHEGRLRTGTGADFNIADLAGRLDSAIDIFDQVMTVEYTPIIESKPTPFDDLLRDKVDGPGSVTLVDGELKMDGTPGLTADYTRDFGRYLPGIVAVAGIRFRMDDPDAGTYRFGYGNGEGNRVAIEVINGAYTTYVESGGVRWYEQARADWIDPLDGTGPSRLNIPDLNGTTLRIKFGHYGGLSFLYYLAIGRREEGDIEVLIDASGPRNDGITLEQPDLPIFFESDSVLYVGGRQFGVYGRYRPRWRVTSTGVVAKDDVGTTLRPIASLRVKQDTKWLSVPAQLADGKMAGSANGEYQIIINGDLTAGGSALTDSDWGDVPGIDPERTALEMNTTADAISGGYKADADIVTGGAGNQQGTPTEDLPDINIPRDSVVTLAAVADSGTGNTFRGVLKIREEW